jgi:hypothetical protein
MKAKEFLEQLKTIREENPEIFDRLKIEFEDEDYHSLSIDHIELDKLYNTLKIYFTFY